MPKLVLRVGPEAAKMPSTEGFARYAGPTPPAGAYPAKVKQITIKESREKKLPMLMVVMELDAPAGQEKAKYNGCPVFNYLIIPSDPAYQYYGLQVGQINRLFDAMSNNNQKVKDAFWSSQAVLDESKNPKLLRVGPLNLKSKDGIPIVVDIKLESFSRKNPSTGEVTTEPAIRVNDVLPPVKLTAVPDAEDEPEEYDEDEAGLLEPDDEGYDFGPEGDDDDEEDEDEGDEPDEDETEDEDEDDEPEEAEPEPEPAPAPKKARATRKPPRQSPAAEATEAAPRTRRKAF